MAEVEVRDIYKEYAGGVQAVNGINLSCRDGEYLVLLGPSGCGKTTLLRMIAGLETPTSGEVLIGGTVVNDLPPRARKIAMVFQSYALYPHKTVYKNIAFPLAAQGVPKAEWRDRVQQSTRLLGIDHLLDRKPRQLSGGERQRVALARALIREPYVFLLDEPLSNLDAKIRATAREELRQVQKRVGVSTIYVTHDQVEALALGDRIAVLNKGKVQQFGTPAEIYNQPTNVFVATFVGSPPMNLVARDGRLVGFRPEHFVPRDLAVDRPGELILRCRVSRLEYLGSDRFVYGTVRADDGDALVIGKLPFQVTAVLDEGEEYEFVVSAEHLRFFDRDSGDRLDPSRV